MQQQPPPSSAINKNQMDYSPSLRFSQAWYSSRTCFTKPENISTTAEVRPKHVVLTTRGVSSSAAGPEGFNLKPKTIGVGPRTSTPTLLVLLIPATDKKKVGVYYLNAFRLSLLVNQCIGYGGHSKVHIDMAD